MVKSPSPGDDQPIPDDREPAVFDTNARSIARNDPLAQMIGRWDWWKVSLVSIVVYGLGEKFLLPSIQGYIKFGRHLSEWRPDLEALQTGFLAFPGFYGFYVWSAGSSRGSIPSLLKSLDEGELFLDESGYRRFLVEKEQKWWWFSRLKWTLISFVVAAALTFGLFNLYFWNFDDPKPVDLWFKQGGTTAKVIALLLLFPVLYVLVQILIRELLLIVTLRQLWKELGKKLVLHSKRDGVAGLGQLATHVWALLVLLALVFITFGLASLLPALRDEDVGDFAIWIIIIWGVYIVFWGLVFGLLVWPAHVAMKRACDGRLGRIARRIDLAIVKVEDNNDQPPLPGDMGEVENLRKLYGWLEEDLATWPVTGSLRKQVSFSALISFVVTAAPLIEYFRPS